jgi:hypothetical protein
MPIAIFLPGVVAHWVVVVGLGVGRDCDGVVLGV